MTKKTLFFKFSVLVFTTIVFALTLHGISHAQTFTDIYVDAVNGTNGPGSGAAAKPYKSITYALLLSTRNNLPDPWHVHIRPGTYDADPVKPPSEREIFPLRLRSEMIFEGTTTATECIIDGQHTGPTTESILTGTDIEGIIIRNLTIQNSLRTGIIVQDLTGTKETPSRLEGCVVHNNKSGGMWTNMPFILTDNTFSNNGEAGVTTDRSTTATNNIFSGNGGAGLAIHGDSTGAISKNTFQNNKDIGFVVGRHIKANVTHNIFTSNKGNCNGGGFYVNTFTGDVTDNTFTGNSAPCNNGGGFFVEHTFTGDVTRNTFNQNNGGFFAKTFIGDVTDNTFTGNSASNTGGFRVDRITGNVIYNEFTGNSAHNSGGFYAGFFTGNVAYNTFTGNSTNRGAGGGFRVDIFTGDITHNKFTRNTAYDGGGSFTGKFTGNVTHNIFDSNSATEWNGGLRLGESPNTAEVSNNIFFNNTSRGDSNSVGTLQATHFMNNLFMISDELSEGVSGARTVYVTSPECRFHNNIFTGVRTAIYTQGTFDLPITHNLFHDIKVAFVESEADNLGIDLAFWELFAVNASDNLEGAPLLVDPVTSRDFHLQAASPAINAGTNQFAPSDDFDGVARPVGKTVDIGPYEYGGKSPQTTDEEPPETVDIPDPNLRAAIEKALGKAPGDPITTADMERLTELSAIKANISNLTGLEGASNLTRLDLWDNSVSDISPVEGLTNLTFLDLWGNSISDISPVVANTGLGVGDIVSINANPLNDAAINTHIPALQSRGVTVEFDDLKPATPEFLLSVPAGISLIHVPLKVTTVDGVAKTITSIADLYDALGGALTINFLITYDAQAQEWRGYFGTPDTGTPADRVLTDDMGVIAVLTAQVSVHLGGNPLGTNGKSSITLNQGINVVGLPLRDTRINRVSDLFTLDGIGGNTHAIILTDGREFKLVGRPGDSGDIEITGGQAFILTAIQAATVAISGEPWTNTSGTATAPPMALTGIKGDTTPVLGVSGSIVSPVDGWGKMHHLRSGSGFRVTVKNLSTGKADISMTRDEGTGYRLTVVDIEVGRAATIGDILEISAQSTNPSIGVQPLRYTVTAEDVKRSLILLPELVAYEIPAETQLLANYPNPFNPETWIPYRLAEDAVVTLTIYDLRGHVVRTLEVGHQVAAVYESRSKAIYWDGRNETGEQVASGVYFYHLSAGRSGLSVPHRSDYSATRKMLILK